MSEREIQNAARAALTDCLGVTAGETVLVVTDEPLRGIGVAFFTAARDLGFEAMLMEIVPRDVHGEEPPEPVVRAMMAARVTIAPTSKSMTHTSARRRACEAGGRVATLPNISPGTLIRGLNADYGAIARRTHRVTELLNKAKVARLTSPLGTDITIPIDGIEAISSTGLIREPGQFGNLPSGESYMMPKEGGSEGVVVIDGSLAGVGKLEGGETITLRVEAGYAVAIEGGAAATRLERMLEPHGRPGRNLAELGVGTNDALRVIGEILEDEKVQGTVHVALGNNKSMGGTIDPKVHLDGIIFRPSLYLDGTPLLLDGKLLVD